MSGVFYALFVECFTSKCGVFCDVSVCQVDVSQCWKNHLCVLSACCLFAKKKSMVATDPFSMDKLTPASRSLLERSDENGSLIGPVQFVPVFV